MILRTRKPGGELGLVVEAMVYYEGFNPAYEAVRYLPDGGLQIVIDMTDEPKFVLDASGTRRIQKCRRSWLSGFRTDFISIGVERNQSMFVIEFKVGNTSPFFRFPLSDIANTVVDGDAVFGPSVDFLRDRIRNTGDVESKFDAAEGWLSNKLDFARGDVRVSRVAGVIRASPTMSSVDQVAHQSGISHKHLIESFRRVIGITPKQFQRVHRFQKVIHTIERDKVVNWAQLALDCGFYDQSHFVNEFKRFSGINPTGYLSAKGDEVNWMPVARR